MLSPANFAMRRFLQANTRVRGTEFASATILLCTRTEQLVVNRYFFNFRLGDEFSADHIGMFLHDLDEARDEAMRTCRDLVDIAVSAGELSPDCELQVADASGEPVLRIPLRKCGDTKH